LVGILGNTPSKNKNGYGSGADFPGLMLDAKSGKLIETFSLPYSSKHLALSDSLSLLLANSDSYYSAGLYGVPLFDSKTKSFSFPEKYSSTGNAMFSKEGNIVWCEPSGLAIANPMTKSIVYKGGSCEYSLIVGDNLVIRSSSYETTLEKIE